MDEKLFDRSFEFGVDVLKTQERDDRWVVTALASDNGQDRARECVTRECLDSFVDQVKAGIPLTSGHFTGFGFGRTVDGRIVQAEDNGRTYDALEVDFELDQRFPESQVLWDEMQNGKKTDRQLSIGGRLDQNAVRPVYYKGRTRYLNSANLEHIAAIRAGQPAANPRTSFTSAIMKSLDIPDDVWESLDLGEDDVIKIFSGPGDPRLPSNVRSRSERVRRVWVAVFNSVMRRCMAGGKTEKQCEGTSFRQANGVIRRLSESKMTDEEVEAILAEEGFKESADDEIIKAIRLVTLDELKGHDEEEDDKPRRLKDLDTFVDMAREGFNAMVMPLAYPGMPGFEDGVALPKIEDEDQIDAALAVMRRAGVENPKRFVQNEKLEVRGLRVGVDDFENEAVGLDWMSSKPILYAKVDEEQLSGEGIREFDELGRLVGGAFPFVAQSRPVLGELAYSMFWPLPSVPELQVLSPKAVRRLEKRMANDEVEKTIEGRFQRMPIPGTQKIKMRTESMDGHSHALILEIDFDAQIVSGETTVDFGHSHRVGFERDEERDTFIPTGRTTKRAGHRHNFAIPKQVWDTMEEFDMQNAPGIVRKDPDQQLYFVSSDGKDGVVILEALPEGTKQGTASMRTYALLVEYQNGDKQIQRLGVGTRTQATQKARRLLERRADVDRIVLGRSHGKLGKRTVFASYRGYMPDQEKEDTDVDAKAENADGTGQDDDGTGDKVVSFKRWPVSANPWSFTAADGDALIRRGGGAETNGGWRMFRDVHTWFDAAADPDNDPPRRKGAYKLPHHKIEGGQIRTFRRGVIAAMAVLRGARGGVRLPAAERGGVFNHLARHFREDLDLTPPERPKFKDEGQPEFDADAYKEFLEGQKEDMGWFDEFLKTGEVPEDKPEDQTDDTQADTAKEADMNEKDVERGTGILAKIGRLFRDEDDETVTPDPEEKSEGAATDEAGAKSEGKPEDGAKADTADDGDAASDDTDQGDLAQQLSGIVTEAVQTALKPVEERLAALEQAKATKDEAADDSKADEAKDDGASGDAEGAKAKDADDKGDPADDGDKGEDDAEASLAKILSGIEGLDKTVKGIDERLGVVEQVGGFKKSLDGQEREGGTTGSVWKGTILPQGADQRFARRTRRRAAEDAKTD